MLRLMRVTLDFFSGPSRHQEGDGTKRGEGKGAGKKEEKEEKEEEEEKEEKDGEG